MKCSSVSCLRILEVHGLKRVKNTQSIQKTKNYTQLNLPENGCTVQCITKYKEM